MTVMIWQTWFSKAELDITKLIRRVPEFLPDDSRFSEQPEANIPASLISMPMHNSIMQGVKCVRDYVTLGLRDAELRPG